jgi:hypothetical protein
MKKLILTLSLLFLTSTCFATDSLLYRKFPTEVVDDTYGVAWSVDTVHAASKKSLYDKIETLGAGGNNWTAAADTGSVLIGDTAETFTIAGGTNVTTSITGNTLTINSTAAGGNSWTAAGDSGTPFLVGDTAETVTLKGAGGNSTSAGSNVWTVTWSSSGLTWAGNAIGNTVGGFGLDTSAWTGLGKVSSGTWTTITDNSSNWNTAYGWGDHSTVGYWTTSVGKSWTGNDIALTTYTSGNYVASVATTSPLTGGAAGSEGATLTIAIPKADTTTNGYLWSTDWNTFNNKQATISNYVGTVADGTGIDGTASGAGSTYTPTLDLTEISGQTISAGASTNFTWTFDLSGTDVAINWTSGQMTLNAGTKFGIGTTTLDETTGATDSGGYMIGLFDEFAFSAGTDVQTVMDDLDAAIPDYYNFTLLPQGAVLDDNNPPAITIIESTGTGTPRFYVADFDASTDEILYFTFIVPDDMGSGNWLADVLWYANDTGANETCVWEMWVSATTEADADTMAEQAVGTTNSASEDVNTTEANRLIQTTITLANLDSVAAGDVVTIRFNRDANNASDDLTSDARLVGIRLRIPRS